MIRYAFLAQLDPPAPFVNVVLRNPARENPGYCSVAMS
jgi:hypothetical protein